MSFQLNQLLDLNYWQQVISTDFLSKDFVINIIDILVVWYLVYKLIMLVRGTKAVQLLKGVAVFIIIRILSEIIGLHTLSWLMNQVIMYGVIAVVVIFQPEVRRGLEHLGEVRFSARIKVRNKKMSVLFRPLTKPFSTCQNGKLVL